MYKPNAQDIAVFRNEIKGNLQTATGYFYYCNEKLNKFFTELENPGSKAADTYCVLMVNKPKKPIVSGEFSEQRNIYFKYDIDQNIFHMQPTGNVEKKGAKIIANEFDIYFFPDARCIAVVDDYPAIEGFLQKGKAFDIEIYDTGEGRANFLNNNANRKFVVTNSHTGNIKK